MDKKALILSTLEAWDGKDFAGLVLLLCKILDFDTEELVGDLRYKLWREAQDAWTKSRE